MSKHWPNGYAREHFLADMINKRDYRDFAELGVWKGRTFLHVLTHCARCRVIGVDAWAYRPENAGIDGGETYQDWQMATLEKHVRSCATTFGERAQILKMETSEAAALVDDGSLDIIFIDADHSENGVRSDIANWRGKVRPGGVIAGHDIDWPTVRKIVRQEFDSFEEGPDNVWWVQV